MNKRYPSVDTIKDARNKEKHQRHSEGHAMSRTSPETVTLKSCPFCGAEPMLHEVGDGVCTIACSQCGIAAMQSPTRDDAIYCWNTRTSDLAQRPAVTKIASAIRDHFKDLGNSPVETSDGIERVYYTGFSLQKLAEAISAASPDTSTDRANRFCKNSACHWPDCIVEGGVCGSPESSPDRPVPMTAKERWCAEANISYDDPTVSDASPDRNSK